MYALPCIIFYEIHDILRMDFPENYSMAVYHLRGETGSSTICANGKQKFPTVCSLRVGHLLNNSQFTERAKDDFDLIIIPRWRLELVKNWQW